MSSTRSLVYGLTQPARPLPRWAFASLLLLSLGACSNQYRLAPDDLVSLPNTWQTAPEAGSAESDETKHATPTPEDERNTDTKEADTAIIEQQRWSELITSESLNAVIGQALSKNQNLAQRALDIDIAAAAIFQSKMAFLPELDLVFGSSKSGGGGDDSSSSFSLTGDLSYTLNLLGQLGDAKRGAYLNYAIAQANYQQAARNLIQQVSSAWADVVEAQQLLNLRNSRLKSLENNLSTIESGYRRGLNQALEVYLARNEVDNEHSARTAAEQNLSDTRRALMLLLGAYPSNTIELPAQFPDIALLIPPELPSTVLTQRPDLQSAWLAVLSQNTNVAIAHKARFPSLRLTSSIGQESDELGALMDNPLGWSLSASLIQPIFNAGSLRANELQQHAQLQQQELAYNTSVYAAFQEVESGLQQQQTLALRHHDTLSARDNAAIAAKLSFEQYLKGLENYATVLSAQRSAVDAEIQLISLKKQMFTNSIALHQALAGELDINHPALAIQKDL